MRKVVVLVLLFLAAVHVAPAAALSPKQLERVRSAKTILAEVDERSLQELEKELSATDFPEGHLQILEAVAATYREMLEEYEATTQGRKEWLHSMILLNMAYFQFGGNSEENDTGLNIVIRRKLKKHLSVQLLADPRLFHSLE
jgi:hypothetical protein